MTETDHPTTDPGAGAPPWTFADALRAVEAGGDPTEAARRLVSAMTPAERLWCLDGDAPCWAGLQFLGQGGYHRAPFRAARVQRLGFPGVTFVDGPRGVVVGNATCFPVPMARAATWDPDLEERIGEVIGAEVRATGATLFGGVCVNLLRHPGWGRAQETYGEDPLHVGEMGAALVRGVQRHAMACVKHYACNSIENSRFTVDVTVDEVALRDVYLRQFARIVDEGVACVMTAYNSVNGDWCGQNAGLITGILRGELGFAGFTISDWIFGLRDAVASVKAGLDIEMPYRMVRARDLPGALAAGEVTPSEVDAAAERVVATVLRFDAVLSRPAPDRSVIASPAHRALAREAAARSVVLLRNEPVDGRPVLPFDRSATVAVIGELAARPNLGDAGSSDVWALDPVTVLDGIAEVAAGVIHDPGNDPARAAAVAADADAAVVVVGCTYLDEGEYIGATPPGLAALFPPADEPGVVEAFQAELETLPEVVVPPHVAERPSGGGFGTGGDRRSLRLSDEHVALIGAVAAANPRTVVVVQAGSAVLTDPWDRSVAGLVYAWYGGHEAGRGLADVLFGAHNPSGRLPFSVPASPDHLPPFDPDADRATYDRWHGWWRLERDGHRPAWPFGFGLSYTTFAVTGASGSRVDGGVAVEVTVANTGGRDGAEVVQVYGTPPLAGEPRRLVGFRRVEVPAGTSVTVTVPLPPGRFDRWDPDTRQRTPITGPWVLAVGRHVADPDALTVTVDI